MSPRIAYFITPHGFGHAARTCAVIEALWRRSPGARIELFTTVPAWFFEQSLPRTFGYHEVTTDLGLVQKSSLEEDLEETVRRLRAWLPFHRREIEELAAVVDAARCDRVVCDVSPLGLAVARHLARPSLLIENFTWDWIYRAYAADQPALAAFADDLAEIFDSAGRRVQTEPLCRPAAGALRVPPISRRPRTGREAVRRRLGVPAEARLTMVTMGGVEWRYEGVESRLATGTGETWLVVPGGSPEPRRIGQAVLLPHRSEFFHPDLIHAADAVIGKLGYSTIAEVASAGLPFGFVPRPTFPESPPVEAWVRRHLSCRRIEAERFVTWGWLDEIEPLLGLPRRDPHPTDGAGTVAEAILGMA